MMDAMTAIYRATWQLQDSVGAMSMLNKVGFVKIMPMHDSPTTLVEGLCDPSNSVPDWTVTFIKSRDGVTARCHNVEKVVHHTQEQG